MNRKPITEHLADLPIEYREEALRLHKESGWANDDVDYRHQAVLLGFPWVGKKADDLSVPTEDVKWPDLYNDLKSKGL